MAFLSMSGRRVAILIHGSVLAMIALPLVSLISSFGIYPMKISQNTLLKDALMVSFKSTMIMMLIVFIIGTPVAYLNARLSYKGKSTLEVLLDLPLVLPPAVAGLLLLMTFGKKGLVGSYLFELGLRIPFSMTAVVIAQLFVALPIYIKTVTEGFNSVDEKLERTAMTLGDTKWMSFIRVSLPLAKGSIVTGAIMAWARGLAEFGATIMFAGSMPSVTQTLPLAIYSAMESDMGAALSIARLMVVISLSLLFVLYRISRKGTQNA